MKGLRIFISLLFAVSMIMGCANVDCPLNNTVYSHWSFYNEDKAVSIGDTLYFYARANGKDTLLINRLYNAKNMDVPLSYYQPADTFILEIHQPISTDSIGIWQDMIIVSKDNLDHFNSPECGIWHEHSVTNVINTNVTIDSIQVVKSKIDTNEDENFRIYFK